MKIKRKRNAAASHPRSAFSAELGAIRAAMGKREYASALQALSAAAAGSADPVARAKIATLTAETQYQMSRYEEAAKYYRAAASLGQKSSPQGEDYWLLPTLGEIRSLLKSQRLDEALQRSAVTIQYIARQLHRRFLRKARNEEGAYRNEICNRRMTKPLRKKIKQVPVRY